MAEKQQKESNLIDSKEKNQESFSLSKRLNSFRFAWAGIKLLFQSEHNARIHLLATIIVLILGFFFHISTVEWSLVILCIGLVLCMEAMNSALEYLANFVSPQKNELIGKAKDLAAGAVLISAIISASIGGIIFIPKLMLLFGSGAKF